jgi:hypothetical protein
MSVDNHYGGMCLLSHTRNTDSEAKGFPARLLSAWFAFSVHVSQYPTQKKKKKKKKKQIQIKQNIVHGYRIMLGQSQKKESI